MRRRCAGTSASGRSSCAEGGAAKTGHRVGRVSRHRAQEAGARRPEKPKVLYVAGAHRSGTTLLASVMDGYEGVFAAGELHEIWQNLVEGQPCGCGLPLDACEVWGPILEEVRENSLPGPLGAEDAVRWRELSGRTWHTGRILRQAGGAPGSSPADRYAALMGSLYEVIARRTGSHVVVDSTKTPSGAALLLTMDHLEPYVVHLIRDPRATAYSWSQRKVRRLSGYEEPLMEQNPLRSGAQWLVYNLLTEWVSRHWDGGWTRLRYEDLAARPSANIDGLASWLGVRTEDGPFEEPDLVRLPRGHQVAGNPDRFDSGAKRVRSDDRWIEGVRGIDRWAVTAVSLPLLRQYGYRLTLGRTKGTHTEKEDS